jgi:hypothetical protein
VPKRHGNFFASVLLLAAVRRLWKPFAVKIKEQFEVNVFEVTDTNLAILPHFRARKSDGIVSTNSEGESTRFRRSRSIARGSFGLKALRKLSPMRRCKGYE